MKSLGIREPRTGTWLDFVQSEESRKLKKGMVTMNLFHNVDGYGIEIEEVDATIDSYSANNGIYLTVKNIHFNIKIPAKATVTYDEWGLSIRTRDFVLSLD